MWTKRWWGVALGAVVLLGGTPARAWAQDNAGPTRMFFGPTGRTLPQGEGYIGAYALILPFAQVGVTNHVTLGGGVPIVPYLLVRGSGHSGYLPFVVSAKARVFHRPQTSVAAGAIHFSSTEGGHAGLAYLVGTRHGATGSASFGAGCAYRRTSSGTGCTPVLTAGGDSQVSRGVSFVTENHLFVGHAAFLSGGVRRTRGRFSTDLGMVMVLGTIMQPGLVMNLAYRFGGS
jgi:hypothetical protein